MNIFSHIKLNKFKRLVGNLLVDTKIIDRNSKIYKKFSKQSGIKKLKRIQLTFQPLISILIVVYNVDEYLDILLNSINSQSYHNIEVIFVYNGSKNSKDFVPSLKFNHQLFVTPNNGFAEAVNFAYEKSNGDFILLLNPDTILKDDTVEKLYTIINQDTQISAVTPKILFSKRFIDIKFKNNNYFQLDEKTLLNSLNYKKYFLIKGRKNSVIPNLIESNIQNEIIVRLPIDEKKVSVILNNINKNDSLNIFNLSDGVEIPHTKLKNKINKTNISFNTEKSRSGEYVINNAGSNFSDEGVFDVGYGQYNHIYYDIPSHINAFCGCCVLLSPEVFLRRKIFISQFFAYFEDSELSNWMKDQKLNIKYAPNSEIYHYHSASITEGSNLRDTLVNRSKDIYDKIVHNKPFYPSVSYLIPNKVKITLKKYDEEIISNSRTKLIKKDRRTLAVYNSFWGTMGGAERRALEFAEHFSNKYEIILISEFDFNKEKLLKYFNISLNCRKLILEDINTDITSQFDIFVNSTYRSSLHSNAKISFYLTSFPHKVSLSNKQWVESYFFLHNSEFTANWSKYFYKNHRYSILYPITNKLLLKDQKIKKRNDQIIFVSIGRFTKNGHCKNHHLILSAYRKALKRINFKTKIFLIGSLDTNNTEDLNYFNSLNIGSSNEEFFPNLDFKKLDLILKESHYYIHATGLNINARLFPEKLEHFGISIIEALSYSLIPLVYGVGGPAEILQKSKSGFTYFSIEELENLIVDVSKNIPEKNKINASWKDHFINTNNFTSNQISKFLN